MNSEPPPPAQPSFPVQQKTFLQRHPIASYFALTFALSWTGALLAAAPHLLHGQPVPKMAGILMFPAMLLGPSVVGIALTVLVDGRAALRELFSRIRRVRFPLRWYAPLLIPPALVLTILLLLKTFVSPVYAPNRFWIGVLFGIPAGFFEEIGWMGFAFPKMREKLPALSAAVLLGLLWGLWHVPVIDYLGTATPHGHYWFPSFLVFAAAMTAMRVLIVWLYSNTKSLLLAQLMHACYTGSLVIFSPPGVTAAQEVFCYALYAAALWLAVALVALTFGAKTLRSSPQ